MHALLLLFLSAAPTVADANAAGMKHYQAKRYGDAVTEFKRALTLEQPQLTVKEQAQQARALALAHFNLACTLALLRKSGNPCEHEAYVSTVWEHVRRAIELDPNRLEKALTDKDLSAVRETLGALELTGLTPRREGDLPKLLTAVTWYSEGQGAYGSMRSVRFKPDGTCVFQLKTLGENGPMPLPPITGRWKLSGRSLSITLAAPLPGAQGTTTTLSFDEGGALRGANGSYFDSPSECDA